MAGPKGLHGVGTEFRIALRVRAIYERSPEGRGLLIASSGLTAAFQVLPEALPRAEDVDGHVLLFTQSGLVALGPPIESITSLRHSQGYLKSSGRELSAISGQLLKQRGQHAFQLRGAL